MTVMLEKSRVQVGYIGHYWGTYQAVPPTGHTIENVMDPGYWAGVAADRKLRINDVFEVRCEDFSWGGDFIIVDVSNRWAKLRLIREVDYGEAPRAVDADSTLKVEFKGPHRKWSVLRKADNEYLRDGFEKRQDAELWARGHLTAMAA